MWMGGRVGWLMSTPTHMSYNALVLETLKALLTLNKILNCGGKGRCREGVWGMKRVTGSRGW